MSISIATIDDVGAFNDVASLSIDSAAASSHIVTSGKKGVIFMNVGNNECWMGGSTVDPSASRGIIMLPRVYFLFRNVTADFRMYFKCAAGITTTVGVIEYA